ncbi:MAG TPA: ABC transporter permease [Chitinophagaceae bacterium]|nr:ABC transporter permease [Chitinophagaceae bacterium]
MLKNYLTIAFRNLLKNKALSFINIFGLASGMACALLIILFIKEELSFDKFNKDPERIYRVVKDFVNEDGSTLPDATTPPALAPAMQKDIPEIESTVRIFSNWGSKYLIKYGDKHFYEEGVYRADSSIFTVFNFPFIKGNPSNAFKQLKSVVFTETAAKKYFGNDDPMGKMVEIDPMGQHMVTGVIQDVPSNSHFKFDFLISTRTIGGGNIDENWGFYNFYTYIKLKPNTSIASVEPKIKALFKKTKPDSKNIYYTQALTGIHLTSNLKWELRPNSDRIYIYVFGTIALFVIIIASINYINLVTAKSSLRAKEVGIRKVVGAARRSLIGQFLTESVFTVFLASLLAIALAAIILPAFNHFTQKELSVFSGNMQLVWMLVAGFTLLIGFIAGLYPAFYLSGFRPAFVLKGLNTSGNNTITLRKVLVVLQFIISVVLIIGSLIINRQLNYMQSAKLGFNKEQVVVINNLERSPNSEAFKNDLIKIPGVKKITSADGMIGGQNWATSLRMRGKENEQLINFLTVGDDFLDVFGIALKEGRGYSAQYPADTLTNGMPGPLNQVIGSIVINEKAVKDLGVPSPAVGQQLVWGTDADTTYYVSIVGVVKDFHFTSLRNEIKPFAFVKNLRRVNSLAVKLDAGNTHDALEQMQNKWQGIFADRPFDYYFLDESINKLYSAEKNFKDLFFYFTIIALIIACLGLFALAAFTAEQRKKEIGIRKVLGASVTNVVAMLSKDFLKLVGIAAFIAFPIVWYIMNKWLQDFTYRINISWWVFVVGGMAAIIIALLTVSFQAIKAAVSNPVKNLRTE